VGHEGAEAALAQERHGFMANRAIEDQDGEAGILPLWRGWRAGALSEEGGDHLRTRASDEGGDGVAAAIARLR
jgi:hypothetical protein